MSLQGTLEHENAIFRANHWFLVKQYILSQSNFLTDD
jgi:hypothetical protein